MSEEVSLAWSALEAHEQTIQTGGFAKAATFLSLSSLIVRVLALLTTSIVARILLPSDYGLVSLALTVIGLLEVLTNVQASGSLIRAKSISDDQLRTAFTLNFARGLLSAAVMFVFAEPIAHMLGNVRLGSVIEMLAIVPLINGLQNPVFVLYERKLHFSPELMRMLAANLIGSIVSIAAAIETHSYWALVANAIVTAFVLCAMTYWRVPRILGFSLSHFRDMFSFGSWLVLVSIIEYMNAKIDVLLVGRGLGTALLGQYQAGGQVVATATGDVVGPLVRAIFPSFARTRDRDELREKYVRIQAVIICLALPIGIGLSALAPSVVRLLLGPNWDLAIPVVQIIGPMFAIQTMLATVDAIAMSTGQTRRLFFRTAIVFVVRVGVLVAGFQLGGYMGVIYARVISGLFYLGYGLRLAAKLTDTSVLAPFASSWRSVFSAIFMFSCLTGLAYAYPDSPHASSALILIVVSRIVIGASIYIFMHAALWWLARRPDGVETLLIAQIRGLIRHRFSQA